MTKDEALKLAQEALEFMSHVDSIFANEFDFQINAIKEALAQPEQEPVAWRYRMSVEDGYWVWNYATYIERQKDDRCEPLYTTPPHRTWVGLTRIELIKCGVLPFGMSYELYEAIEQALKERNT